jgi:hypothetical protein
LGSEESPQFDLDFQAFLRLSVTVRATTRTVSTETPNVDSPVENAIVLLGQMTLAQLRIKYQELFGEPPRSRHKRYLIRRIAWRIQALTEGDLSQRALRRAAELACDADLRLSAPASLPGRQERLKGVRTPRRSLPPAGTVLARHYQGRAVEVTVLAQGFEYEGQTYRSLSAVVKAVTGSHWNGYHFFGLRKTATQARSE